VVLYPINLYPGFQTVYHSTTTFTTHLVNQGVAHELVALQILVLLERPLTFLSKSPLVSRARSGHSSR
jgi:hypothetical protein